MKRLLLSICILIGLHACSEVKKVGEMNRNRPAPTLVPADDITPQELGLEACNLDTAKLVEVFGTEMYLMEEGERIAPSIKIASFKNVAERHGKVDLRFRIGIPEEMLHDRFQIRIFPSVKMARESVPLESVFITGASYRKFQLRGYQRYERFLQSIVTDTSLFIRKHDLEVFLKRNIPQLYELKQDTTFVSEEQFESIFGVNEAEAVAHYTNGFLKNANERRKGFQADRFKRYVKSPILYDGIRLDTIIRASDGRIEYEYVQTVKASADLRKAEIFLSGEIWEPEKKVYDIPVTEPLTFYISTLSSLVDASPRYKIKVVERYVHEISSYSVFFEQGRSELRRDFGNNDLQLKNISDRLSDLASDMEFDIDSVKVTASASPEGSWSLNSKLSSERGKALCRLFAKIWPLHYTVLAENWPLFSERISSDGYLGQDEKDEIFSLIAGQSDPDQRERLLSEKPYYKYLKEEIYPNLRLVQLECFLKRKNMEKDTVHTRELDTTYMSAVQMIRDRDYKSALPALRDASDINTAICYVSLDYNDSAMSVLNSLEENAKVLYLKALILSRQGSDKEALEKYLDACKADKSYVHRGNLDPEISRIIKKFKIKTNQL